MKKQAVISECKRYRYFLTRQWGEGEVVCYVGLNPSTADATNDDPTLRRCIAFAKEHGYSGMSLVNLYALRATDPAALVTESDPIGIDNDKWLRWAAENSNRVVVAWGAHRLASSRAASVLPLLGRCWCLGTTKDGAPRHPLYVKSGTPFLRFQEAQS